jgi:hypothetical protein
MFIIYNEYEYKKPFNLAILDNINPNKQYKTHLENYFYLKFINMNSKDGVEIYQSNKELEVCQRKLDYWRRSQDFDENLCLLHHQELTKKWSKK